MYKKSPPKELLDRIVRMRRPDAVPLLELIGRTELTEDQRWLLQATINEEFLDEGLREDSEPNEYGLELEDLIDWIASK